jgi:poly(A)-specific ribonuclease
LVALEQPQPRNAERGGDDSESEDDLPQHLLNENRGPERSEPPEFLVRKYNFVLFPAGDGKREVVLNPKTMEYLNGQEMNLEEWIKRGIPYMTLKDAQDELDRFLTEHHHGTNHNDNNCKKKKTTNGTMVDFNRNSSSMVQVESACPTSQSEEEEEEEEESVEEPTDPVDVAFVARSMAALREWIDSAAPQRGGVNVLSDNLTLLQEQRMGIVKILPHTRKEPVRRYLRRKIEYEYPALYWDTNDNQQVLVRLNDEEKQVRDARRKKYAWQKMHEEKIGFTRVFKALSDACRGQLGSTGSLDEEYEYFLSEADSKRARGVHKGHGNEICASLTKHASHKQGRRVPIVVHNGFLDFMFLLSHFSSDKLPSTYVEAKELIHDLFPLIYDTKVIATEFHESSMHLKQTSLEELHQRYVRGDTIPDIHDFVEVHLEYTPRSIVVNGSARIHTPARPREAGNNALMVGTVFQCLCRRIKWNSSDFLGLDNVNKKLKMLRAISRAKKCRVGSLLFLDEKVPESKLSAPLYGLNKVSFLNLYCATLLQLLLTHFSIHCCF